MKKIMYFLISVTIITGLLPDCKKDTSGPTYSIVIGVLDKNLIVNTFDTTINIYYGQSSYSYKFDVDNDGNNDFSLNNEYGESPSGSYWASADIEILNNSIEISVLKQIDTVHVCYSMLHDTIRLITYYNNLNYTCPGDSKDTISYIDTLIYPKSYAKGSKLNISETWYNKSMTLYFWDYSDIWVLNPLIHDSITKGKWNNTNMKYILFRINRNNIFHYGWLKLSIFDGTHIQFFEYAYQK